jgi:hypothetical protein
MPTVPKPKPKDRAHRRKPAEQQKTRSRVCCAGLTDCASCAIPSRYRCDEGQLDRSGDAVAGSQAGSSLDDSSYFRLVEMLAHLSSVDLAAVLQGVRYRRHGAHQVGALPSSLNR